MRWKYDLVKDELTLIHNNNANAEMVLVPELIGFQYLARGRDARRAGEKFRSVL